MNEPSTKPRFTGRAVESAINKIGAVNRPKDEIDEARGALEAVRSEAASTPRDEFYMPRDRMGALVQSAMAERLGQPAPEELGPDFLFSDGDPGWASVLPSLIERWLTVNAPFRTHESHRVDFDLPDKAGVALFSDWGTGRPAADQVMREIVKGNPDIAIHLGDIYYSGQEHEVVRRFLDHFPGTNGAGAPMRRFALNGNHEMYSGGRGYFDVVLAAMEQEASYFCLSNANWRLIGLDTAYKDKVLADPQMQWLNALLAVPDGRKTILLSHHQAFSLFEEVDPRGLYEQVRPLLEAGKIHAWFWGHEHNHVVFRLRAGMAARCIGHGAIPYFSPNADFSARTFPDLKPAFVNRRRRPDTLQGVNGFAMLRFDGPELMVDYIDEDGTVTRTEDMNLVLSGVSV